MAPRKTVTGADGGGVLRPRPHVAAGRFGAGDLVGPEAGGAPGRPEHPRGSPRLPVLRAVRGEPAGHDRPPATPPGSAAGGPGRRPSRPARSPPTRSSGWCSRSPSRSSTSTTPPARLVVPAMATTCAVVDGRSGLLAQRLGLDDVLATRYGENDDGTYPTARSIVDENSVWESREARRRAAVRPPRSGHRPRRRGYRLLGLLVRPAAASRPSATPPP